MNTLPMKGGNLQGGYRLLVITVNTAATPPRFANKQQTNNTQQLHNSLKISMGVIPQSELCLRTRLPQSPVRGESWPKQGEPAAGHVVTPSVPQAPTRTENRSEGGCTLTSFSAPQSPDGVVTWFAHNATS